MLRLLKVTGNSLSPDYNEGDFVLVARIPFVFAIHTGDVIVFRQPGYGTLIKRVERVVPDGEEIYVVGTHEGSVDSRAFGAIHKKDVVGKVVWQIRKRPPPLSPHRRPFDP